MGHIWSHMWHIWLHMGHTWPHVKKPSFSLLFSIVRMVRIGTADPGGRPTQREPFAHALGNLRGRRTRERRLPSPTSPTTPPQRTPLWINYGYIWDVYEPHMATYGPHMNTYEYTSNWPAAAGMTVTHFEQVATVKRSKQCAKMMKFVKIFQNHRKSSISSLQKNMEKTYFDHNKITLYKRA